MKKILSILIIALMATGSVLADDVSAEQALQIASQFANGITATQARMYRVPSVQPAPKLAHAMKSRVAAGKDNVYVINYGNDLGFVVVSGETGVDDVLLGYCDHGSFDFDSCPVQMKDLLASYSTTIDSLRQNPAQTSPRRVAAFPSYIGNITVGPLLTTTWSQWGPYNANCPEGCPTGCYPTAIAQVMNYWKWPKTTIGMVGSEDFSGHTYDWDNMLDHYGTRYNNAQANAVAKLMADIGKAFHTMYSPESSPTYFLPQPLVDNFGYEPDIGWQQAVTADELQNTMKTELNNGRPVLYSGAPGFESTDVLHALVCDGYTDKDYFHFNYGWGGSCDGFYKNALVRGYSCAAIIFTNVRPYDAIRKVIDNIEYGLLKDGTADVLSYKPGGNGSENGDVTIPAVVTDDEGKEYRVTRIRRHAFYSKGKFNKITIGDNIETIDQYAFIMSTVNEVVFGDKAKEVPDNAFAYGDVRKLTIGASIRRIGKQAFSMCNVGEITCKSPAFEVDDEAFYNNSGLDTGEWLSHITKIGRRAFSMCYFLKAPDFENLEEIGSEAFFTCIFKGGNGVGDGLFVIPPKLKSIAPDAFNNSAGLWYFMVPDNPNFHSSPQRTNFLLNNNSTSLIMTTNQTVLLGEELPETVVKMEPRSVRPGATIRIPNSVVEMEGAFKDCENLNSLKCFAVVPPAITEATFHEKALAKRPTLYVPQGCRELYENAPGWNRFKIQDNLDYVPAPQQGRQYYMVVNATDENQQRVSIPVSEVGSMQIADDGQHVVIKRNGKDDYTTTVAAIDSITWMPGFVYENAEVYELNDSTLTVEAQKCTVTFDATCIDDDVQLCVRNSVLTPNVMEGVTRGFTVDLSLSNDAHELSGTVNIAIPVSPQDNEKVCAAYYNETTGEWEPVCFRYDEASGTAIITTNHLSSYAVFYVNDPLSCLAMIDYYGITPTLYDIDEAMKKLLHIISSDDPDAQMAMEFKDEMSFWQSVGLDGIYNAVTSISEPLLNFKPEALDNAVTAMGYLGTAMNILDIVAADIKGDDLAKTKAALNTILGYAGGEMAAAIGTPIMSAAMGCAAFIGIALEKFGTTLQEHRNDVFRQAYKYYYTKEAQNRIGGRSIFKGDKNKYPHDYFRTTKDWYNYLYPIFAEGKMTQTKMDAFIEYAVKEYTERFWKEDPEIIIHDCLDFVSGKVMSSYPEIYEYEKEKISNDYYAELMNGEMVSVIQAIKNNLEQEADKRYKSALKKVGAIVNTQYKLAISDSSKPSDGKSKYAGWKMRFANIASDDSNGKEWECTIGDDGTATLGYFTVYALLQKEMPFEVVLCDRDGIEKKTWKFTISEKTGKRMFKVDLAKSGVEVEAPKLKDLTLTYDPAAVEIPMTVDGFHYYYDFDNNLVKEPWTNILQISCFFNGALNKQARFQYEIEKFFKNHDFITVDDADHVKIGDDIVGTMTGNEGSGKFTINTSHQFVEKTKEQFVQRFNKVFHPDGDVQDIFNLLNGTINHKIDCEFTVLRDADDSYTVTYTGTGTYKFEAEGVALVENYDWTAETLRENKNLTIDDISTGITEAEGTVTLQYTTKISM